MIICRVLCTAAIIVGAFGWIPYDEIDFELLDGYPKTMESQIRHTLSSTRNFFGRKDVDCGRSEIPEKILNYVPFVNQMKIVLPVLQRAIATDVEWKSTLNRDIQDMGRRNTIENDLRSMESVVRTIIYHMNNLNPNKNMSAESKAAIVHNVHDSLDIIVTKFAQRQSIFRKYSLLGMPIYLTLASVIALFVPIERALVTELSRGPMISCKLYEALIEYRSFAVESRLMKLDIVDSTGVPIHKRNPINTILAKTFNEYGYNQTNDPVIVCREECRPTDGEYVYVCLKDHMSGTEYDCNRRYEMYSCMFGYMEYVRHRVEQIFTDAIELTVRSCRIEARNRPRINKTGYGWWEIIFLEGTAVEDATGKSCDEWDDCDPFIKLFIDGREVFRSRHRSDNHLLFFGETYHSPKMIRRARITIEMWDDDSGWMASPDDLIMRWDTTIDELIKNGVHWSGKGNVWKNRIVTASTWRDEYPDWELQRLLLN